MSLFVRPEWLWLLIAVAAMAAAGLRGRRAGRVRAGEGMPFGPRLGWFEVAAVALLAAALADPRGLGETADGGPTMQVAFAVDVSRSMAVEDCGGESRMAAAASLLQRLADSTEGRPRTLTAFAGLSKLVSGLSRDSRLGSPLAAASDVRQGSDLTSGVRAAADTLAVGLPGGRVVVVLSDGESQTPPRPIDGVEILGVCIGREGVVPAGGWASPSAEPLRFEGEIVRSRADAAAMRAFGGPVWSVETAGEVDAVVAEIEGHLADSDEASARATSTARHFRPLLVLAVLLLAATAVRRRVVVAAVLLMTAVSDPFILGHRLADRGEWADAAAAFGDVADADANNADAWYNRGTSLARAVVAGQSEDVEADLRAAIRDLRRVVRMRPDRQDARVNLQLAYRLLRQGKSDGGERSSSSSEKNDPGDSPDTQPPHGDADPFAGDSSPMTAAEADELLDDARGRDPGPSSEHGGRADAEAAELRPW